MNLDLTNCDKEKIHQITYTQGHGTFVAVTPFDLRIKHCSENLTNFFELDGSSDQFLGRRLNEIISLDLTSILQDKLRSGTIIPGNHARMTYNDLDVYVFYLKEDLYGIEFEKIDLHNNPIVSPEDALSKFLFNMQNAKNLEDLAEEACRAVRYLSGMERVMAYKFFPPTMYGEVIAEDKIAEAHSFLRHRFPATDIPKPARDLYLRNQVRFIHDSAEPYFEILPKSSSIDMSDSRLRGVSLIHLEYLKNMGVRGSLSVAIIVENKLWGLISCHSSKPIQVSQAQRKMCETVAHALSLGANVFEQMEQMGKEVSFYHQLHEIFNRIKKVKEPLDQLFREGTSILQLFNCQGMVLVDQSKIDFFGITPLAEDIKRLGAWLLKKMDDEGKTFIITESLAHENGEFESLKDQVSGLIAIRLSDASNRVLIFMRAEYVETILWGGDPRKNIDARNYGGTINPRASFETWTEILKNNSVNWTKTEIKGVELFKNLVFDSLILKEEILNELHERIQTLKNVVDKS